MLVCLATMWVEFPGNSSWGGGGGDSCSSQANLSIHIPSLNLGPVERISL